MFCKAFSLVFALSIAIINYYLISKNHEII